MSYLQAGRRVRRREKKFISKDMAIIIAWVEKKEMFTSFQQIPTDKSLSLHLSRSERLDVIKYIFTYLFLFFARCLHVCNVRDERVTIIAYLVDMKRIIKAFNEPTNLAILMKWPKSLKLQLKMSQKIALYLLKKLEIVIKNLPLQNRTNNKNLQVWWFYWSTLVNNLKNNYKYKVFQKKWNTTKSAFSQAPKSLHMVTTVLILKDACSLEEKLS